MTLCQIVAHEVNLENIRRKDKVRFIVLSLVSIFRLEPNIACTNQPVQALFHARCEAHLSAQQVTTHLLNVALRLSPSL